MINKRLIGKELFTCVILLITIALTFSYLGWQMGYVGLRFSNKFGKDLSDYKRVVSIIESEYFSDFNKSEAIEKSVNGLVESLDDPYSYYMSKDEYEKYFFQKTNMPSLEYKTIDDKTVYAKISQFGVKIKAEFSEVINQITQNSTRNLIIDLRDNTGGIAGSEVYIADQFLDSGTIYIKLDRNGKKEPQLATSDALLKNIKVVVLTNQNTASSAEVLIAALAENNKAIVVGEKTKGKSTEQTFFELTDGSAI
ncbi:MAG: hypothetical protein ACD_24C00254G0001, partial [uncultured bacterium]